MFWRKWRHAAAGLFGWRHGLGPPKTRSSGRRVRPGFDVLEDRTAPATYTWTDANANVNGWWSNPANWS